MTHTYQLTGMTCGNCEASVKTRLLALPEIKDVEVSRLANSATLQLEKPLSLGTLQQALGGPESKYRIAEAQPVAAPAASAAAPAERSWLETYRPILLIFGYITVVTLLIQYLAGEFTLMDWMRHFMAGFFLTFSFFKLLNLRGFTESYAMYDVVAKRIPVWGTLYAFIELGLGLAYLTDFEPLATNLVTLVVMSLSIIGVLQSVLNKKKIQCACLGAVFELPMSTVTIIEDALMIAMSAVMVLMLW